MRAQHQSAPENFLNNIFFGDSVIVMQDLPSASIDFVLTDPPYLTSYQPRDGRKVTNDDKGGAWLEPAFREIGRVLRDDAFCVTFYGWPVADRFVAAFRAAGLRPVSHLVFVKEYASYTGYTRSQHEVAYLLAKGRPAKPEHRIRCAQLDGLHGE